MKARTIILRLLGALLVMAVVWAVVVFLWHASESTPDVGEVVLYLIALPVALVGGYWLLRWGHARRQAKRALAPEDAIDTDTKPATLEGPPAPDRVLHLLASAVLLPAGASAIEVAEALPEPKRPSLHPQLKDFAGLPVFAAQVDGVNGESVLDALQASLGDGWTVELLFNDERLRAVALLDAVAEELLHLALPAIPAEAEAAPIVGPGLRGFAKALELPTLRIRVLLPAAWPQAARETVAGWLQRKAEVLGHRSENLAIEIVPVQAVAEIWRLLDQIAQAQAREPDDDRILLLAAHSWLGEHSIEQLDARGGLLSSARAEGAIPGEGAAGLLLVGAHVRVPELEQPPLRLHRVIHAQATPGAHARAATRQATALIERALASAALPSDTVSCVVSDADHRPSRAIEIAGAVAGAFPELDPVQHCLNLGVPCGHLGAVAPLALLAIAAAQADKTRAPVLAMSLADDTARAALAVSPLPVLATDSRLSNEHDTATATAAAA